VLVNLPNADLVLLIFRGFIFYETELKFNHFVAGFFPLHFPPVSQAPPGVIEIHPLRGCRAKTYGILN